MSRLDELIELAEAQPEPPPVVRRREIVHCEQWRGQWIVVKLLHRNDATDGHYVAQTGCGMYESKPAPLKSSALEGARQHIRDCHGKHSTPCPRTPGTPS